MSESIELKPVASNGATRALIAGFLGWTLDAFDFFLVTLSLGAIAKDLHVDKPKIALSIAVTLAFRPVGAFIFGLLADRYGRRLPMMIDLIFYSAVEVATGFAHSFTSFIILRALFGIGMGGEWGVGASLVMEKVSPRWRGLLSGVLQEGYAAGYLLAAVAYGLIFPHYGWRPLFFLGGAPALLALFIRFGISESEVWEKNRQTSWPEMMRGLTKHWKIFLYLTALMACMNFSSHGTQDMYPTFLEQDWGFTPERRAVVTAISMVGAILGGIGFGLLSDRIGRRTSMAIAFAGAILSIPLWAFAPNLNLLICGAFLIQTMVQGAWGVIPAHINELSPNSARGFIPGFAYQCGVLIAGSIGYLQSIFAKHMPYSKAMAGSAAVVFVLALIVTIAGPEKRAVRFDE